MLSWIAKLALTSTALVPVGLTYSYVVWQTNSELGKIILGFCLGLTVLCILVLCAARSHLERHQFQPVQIEAADRENIAFLLLYIMPLFTSQFDTMNWDMWAPTLIIFAIVVSTGYGYHFNPLLGIFGWHFYKVTTSDGVVYVLITRKQLRSAKSCLTVGQLTEYIVLDME